MEAPEILTLGEVAKYLKVDASTIYRLLRRRELPAFKIGADWRFRREEIDRWRMGQAASEIGGRASVTQRGGTDAMQRLIIILALVLVCASCGSQGSMMMPTYLGEGQGIASQLMGMASQVQNYEYQQQMMRLQEQQLQRQQQQINSAGNP